MQKSIEISCPARLTLFFNQYYDSNNINHFRIINQTISLYDKLTISEEKNKYNGIKIITNPGIKNFNNNILLACKLFFDYTQINHDLIHIEIEKVIPTSKGLAGTSSDVAGILLGLNQFYHTNLTKKELLLLASHLGRNVPYFIVSGYALINDSPINIEKLHHNPFYSYLIIEPNLQRPLLETNQIKTNRIITFQKELYNDFSKYNYQELIRLKEYLQSQENLQYLLLNKGPIYFVASKEKYFSSSLMLKLKKEFPEYKIYNCENTNGYKILKKYPTTLDIYRK